MIDDIKNGTLDIDVVVVYKLDRFFRNEKLSHAFICVNIYKVKKNNLGYEARGAGQGLCNFQCTAF